MSQEDLDLVRACFEDWRTLAGSANVERLQEHRDAYYDPDLSLVAARVGFRLGRVGRRIELKLRGLAEVFGRPEHDVARV